MNLDLIIFIGFLLINLAMGLTFGRGVTNIREFALGKRNFSTATIATTLVATWVDGSFFSVNLSKTYTDGLYFILPAIGDFFAFLIIAHILAPNMKEFLGKLSVAEAIGDLYGKHARIITAVAAIGLSTGVVALQIKVLSNLLNQFFLIDSFYGLLASTAVVVIYSTFGGIRAVTFTDVIQLFTFGTFIPGLALIIWGTMNNPEAVFSTLSNNPLFDYTAVLDYNNPRFLSCLALFLWFMIPGLDPAIFQRISMAKNISQVSKSFSIAAIVCLFALAIISWIGVLVLSYNTNLDSKELLSHIITNYSYLGLKSFIIIGIMAMIMSTTDSYINSAAVLFAHDFCRQLKIKWVQHNELLASRLFTIVLGVGAIVIALSATDLLDLTLIASSFYMPVVTAPLILAILGFRTTSKIVLFAMANGFTTVLVWRFIDTDVNSVIPGTIVNFLTLLLGHYIFRQPGGWQKSTSSRYSLRFKLQKIATQIKNWSIFKFIGSNVPTEDSTYPFFGLFCIASIFSSVYSLPPEIVGYYVDVLGFIYHSVLISSTIFLSYPLWPAIFKRTIFIKIMWLIGVFYILIFVGSVLVLLSNFSQFQLMIFVLNLVVIAILHRWQFALVVMFSGVILSTQLFKWYFGVEHLLVNMGTLQFKIMYTLLLVTSVFIALIKPKQDQQYLTEAKNEHLLQRITEQEEYVRNAMAIKGEFIRNISHEYHAPMTGISSMAQVLLDNHTKFNAEQLATAIETILKSSLRLEVFDANISTLSRLSTEGYKLNIEPINFSDLIYERVKTCRKLYEDDKSEREFILNIEEKIKVNGDKYYLTQLLDDIIINAITYCNSGAITITLKKINDIIECRISDEGVGIPPNELYDIFAEFTVGSKTKTDSGGRGVGLAVANKVVKAHGGTIRAESDGKKGTSIIFTLNL